MKKKIWKGGVGSWPPRWTEEIQLSWEQENHRVRLLVRVTVRAGSEEGRPAGQEPSAKGLSVEGGMTYQVQNLSHRKFCFLS